jgi:enoyl-[acyl-carrier-protein] reductase (NADH)
MKLLEGKTALIFGVANDHSIAWGIARSMHEEGANVALSYATEALERRVKPLAESIGSGFVEICDVTKDGEIDNLFLKAKSELGRIDILVHAVAFANREDMLGRFKDTRRHAWTLQRYYPGRLSISDGYQRLLIHCTCAQRIAFNESRWIDAYDDPLRQPENLS